MKLSMNLTVGLMIVALLSASNANSGIRERIEKRQAQRAARAAEPINANVIRDFAYGTDKKQRMDIYLPSTPNHVPIIFMVHGGAWRLGDKTASSVTLNKVTRWASKGFIVISSNNRLLPEATAYEQVNDVALALASAQTNAEKWGGNRDKLVLMGHSAGAHIVSVLSSNPALVIKAGGNAWLGTVSLDSAAMDVPSIMQAKHARFYNDAFGENAQLWADASPIHQLSAASRPLLAVCSTQRKDDSCGQANKYAKQAQTFNVRVEVLPQNLSHMDINKMLGLPSDYTIGVEKFMSSLDPELASYLQ